MCSTSPPGPLSRLNKAIGTSSPPQICYADRETSLLLMRNGVRPAAVRIKAGCWAAGVVHHDGRPDRSCGCQEKAPGEVPPGEVSHFTGNGTE